MDGKDQPPMYQHAYQSTSGFPPQTAVHTQVYATPSSSTPAETVINVGQDSRPRPTRMTSEEEEDIYRVDGNIKVGFEDVFPEPTAYEKLAPVRNILSMTYHYVQLGFYGFLTVTAGLFLSIAWAIVFAFMNFADTWFVQPFLKVSFFWIRSWAIIFRASIRAFCDPMYGSMALALSKIKGRFKLAVTGINKQQLSESEDV